ncbi:MAG: SHOCT domain-containing protein [Nocardioides sp.]
MDAITTDFWEVLLWSFWFFIWIAALMVWFQCLFDLFGDSSLGGWAKAGWAILMIFVPWLGALIYLIARGKSMSERKLAAAAETRAEQEKYIKQMAGNSQGPAEEIARAKELHDSGVIDQAEFEALKAKALA